MYVCLWSLLPLIASRFNISSRVFSTHLTSSCLCYQYKFHGLCELSEPNAAIYGRFIFFRNNRVFANQDSLNKKRIEIAVVDIYGKDFDFRDCTDKLSSFIYCHRWLIELPLACCAGFRTPHSQIHKHSFVHSIHVEYASDVFMVSMILALWCAVWWRGSAKVITSKGQKHGFFGLPSRGRQ